MSDIRDDGRISAMPKATSLVGSEKVPIVTAAGENKYIEASLMFGQSAYQVYADIEVAAGRVPLSEPDWLLTLKGDDGPDGPDGKDGPVGPSAYDVYAKVETDAGRVPLDASDWSKSLVGKDAYQVYAAAETAAGRQPLSQSAWLLSLKGADGKDGTNGTDGTDGKDGGIGPDGPIGPDGLTAYQVYAAAETAAGRTPLTQVAWLVSLQGKSAYQSYVDTTSDLPKKTETEWLLSLKGAKGDPGVKGVMGTGLYFVGTLDSVDELPDPSTMSRGDTFVINKHYHMNNVTEWTDLGDFGGERGLSAYDVYAAAASAQGEPVLSEGDWLKSLQGPPGTGLVIRGELPSVGDLPTTGQKLGDAYIIKGYQHVWVTPEQSLDNSGWSVVGVQGPEGKSAYQSYRDRTADNPIKSEAEWLLTLVGPEGKEGKIGPDGKVGPQGAGIVVLATLTNVSELATAPQAPLGHGYLVGTDYHQWNGTAYINLGPIKGTNGTNGTDGTNGKSAYQSYLDTTGDVPKKTEANWLLSLKGKDGTNGKDGANGDIGPDGPQGPGGQSAYELYVSLVPSGQTPMTPSDWINSLRGTGLTFLGTKPTVGDLPTGAEVNDAWIVGTNVYISDGADNWADAGDIRGPQGPEGKEGPIGKDGPIGPDGKSAYQVYADIETAASRTPLSVEDWLISLRTQAYAIRGERADVGSLPTGALLNDAYFVTATGSLYVSDGDEHWTDIGPVRGQTGATGQDGADGGEGPIGPDGPEGKSAYQVYAAAETTAGRTPLAEAAWLLSLKGADGTNGTNGKSAYQVYVDVTVDNPKKTETEWLLSLKGKDGTNGKTAYEVYAANTTDNPVKTIAQWLDSLHGQGISPRGTVADIAALNAITGMQQGWMYYVGTHQWVYGINGSGNAAWLDGGDLRGPIGMSGKSAYEVYVNDVPVGDAPMTEADWLVSLKGEVGDTGPQGAAITLKGSVLDLAALNAIVSPLNGDGYFLTDDDVLGDLYVHYAVSGWVYQGNFRGPDGVQGPMGPGIAIVGSLPNEEALATAPAVEKGEGYLIAGEFHGWTGTEYQNMGKVQGPTGPQGPIGKTGLTGPEGPRGFVGPRGSILIMLPRDPQIVDGTTGDAFQNTATNAYYQKTSETNWAYMGTFGGGNVNDATHDGEMKVRLDGAWVKLPVQEAPTTDANALYMRKGSSAAWVKFNRYDLAKVVSADGSVDCAQYNGAEIDGTKTQTIALNNLPAGRIMTIVITVVGKGGNLTWPAALKWSNAEAPTLGTTYTNVVVYWDGSRLTGSVGQSV